MGTCRQLVIVLESLMLTGAGVAGAAVSVQAQGVLQTSDLTQFRSVEEVALSPDGRSVAYTVAMRDQPGRPYTQVWVADIATQKSMRIGSEHASGASPHWSPDGKWIAYEGADGDQNGLWIVHPDGSGAAVVAPVASSNAPLPERGQDITWAPDGKQIAFICRSPARRPRPRMATPRSSPAICITRRRRRV